MVKKVVYQDEVGMYEALRDDVFYKTANLDKKEDSWWNIKKGQRIGEQK
ncbi:MAG: hypothetical protein RR557_07820 [Bacilli bacterium]